MRLRSRGGFGGEKTSSPRRLTRVSLREGKYDSYYNDICIRECIIIICEKYNAILLYGYTYIKKGKKV